MTRFAQMAVIAALTIGVTAVAQENRKSRRQPNQPSQPAAAPAEKPAAAPTTKPGRPIRGEIQAVDIESKTVTVTVRKKGEDVKVVVETDASTEFTLDDAKATLVDLKPGMRIMVAPDTGIAAKVSARSVSAKEQSKRNDQAKRSNSQSRRRNGDSGKRPSDTTKQPSNDSGTAEPSKPADSSDTNPKSEQ